MHIYSNEQSHEGKEVTVTSVSHVYIHSAYIIKQFNSSIVLGDGDTKIKHGTSFYEPGSRGYRHVSNYKTM